MAGYPGRSRSGGGQPSTGVQRSYASQLKEHEPLFNTYEHLQGLPRSDVALTLLRKVASLVKPIMRKHGWKVQTLAEFLPPEANLLGLNINQGAKICIRLRFHNNPDLFLPIEQVVDTMLHELSHNVWGAHDSNFHRLWDELRDEHETLVRKGYTGEGFLSEGKRLGGGAGNRRPVDHDEMRRLARASAEKRQAQSALSKGSGSRLGGTPLHLLGRDIRQVIADQVTRRNAINKGCGSGRNDAVQLSDQSAARSFKTKAEEDDANDRAILQALQELAEEDEKRTLQGNLAAPSPDGGLAWHPIKGLYDPRTETAPEAERARNGEDDDMDRALAESMQATVRPQPERGTSKSPIEIDSTPSKSAISAFLPSPSRATSGDCTSPHQAQSILIQTSHPPPIRSTEPVIDLSEPFDPNTPGPEVPPPDSWACEVCTCINPTQFLSCDACTAERPQSVGIGNRGPLRKPKQPSTNGSNPNSWKTAPSVADPTASLGWLCGACGAFMEHRWWTCSACGRMKDAS